MLVPVVRASVIPVSVSNISVSGVNGLACAYNAPRGGGFSVDRKNTNEWKSFASSRKCSLHTIKRNYVFETYEILNIKFFQVFGWPNLRLSLIHI